MGFPDLCGLKVGQAGCETGDKKAGLKQVEPSELAVLRGREVCEMRGVAVK